MKKLVCTLLFFGLNASQIVAQETPVNPSYIYKKADTDPEYNGGMMSFTKYVRESVGAAEVKDTLTLMATFVVEKDGSLSGVRFMNRKPVPRTLAATIRESPKWTPATIKGKPVRFQIVMPIRLLPKN